MSDDSPKRMPCRVRSTFDIANPLTELPAEPIILSPETIRRRQAALNDVLTNATCEEGTSMDSIATYIPPHTLRKQGEEETARLKALAIAEATGKAAKKAAKIAALEEQLAALKKEAAQEHTLNFEKLAISHPTSVVAHGVAFGSSATAEMASGVIGLISPTGSNNTVFVAPPAIGALVAAPPAMGALMGAPPGIGALVVAALQPATQPSVQDADREDDASFGDDFQLIHNEYVQALAVDKKKQR
ncbi:unnamed protein product [Caenorhabditis sp. 36 PRJEB53466]|nr:unnamed protein product [Caenorhabditis sp. 36 PRJEB53466]